MANLLTLGNIGLNLHPLEVLLSLYHYPCSLTQQFLNFEKQLLLRQLLLCVLWLCTLFQI
jgi:hypothetical protein